MRLPHPKIESWGFLVESPNELGTLLGNAYQSRECELIKEYFDAGLPPVTSLNALSVMFGYNPGFVWSLLNRTSRYYRTFYVPKGKGKRKIYAPKVALKIIQKWLAVHFNRRWECPEDIFGFVPGKSHIQAADRHLGATWVISVDIENFFPSVTRNRVEKSLQELGYHDLFSLEAITSLACYGDGLAQGAPSSPVISNVVLSGLDLKLKSLARKRNCIFTRYADDIVFSGRGEVPDDLMEDVCTLVRDDGWRIAKNKKHFSQIPSGLRVHGLLVHGTRLRLPKGYRNRLRAYRHLLESGKIRESDHGLILGHLAYAQSVERVSGT